MNSLAGNEVTFKEIERSFFEIGCEVAKMLMQEFLGKVDKELSEARDKAELRHKGTRATTIKTLMGEQTISHQGVWNIVQAVGEKQAEAERRLIKANENNELKGSREVGILFEEADGLWLSMQGI